MGAAYRFHDGRNRRGMNSLDRYAIYAFAIVLMLAAVGVKAYKAGQHNTQVQWDAAKAQAVVTARAKEQLLNLKMQEAQNEATKRENQLRQDVAAATAASDGMRGTIDQLKRKLSHNPTSTSSQAAIATGELLQDCSDKYRGMAEVADRHAQDAAMMQAAWPK